MSKKRSGCLLWVARAALALALACRIYLFIYRLGFDEPGFVALHFLGLACLAFCTVTAMTGAAKDWRLTAIAAGLTIFFYSIYSAHPLVPVFSTQYSYRMLLSLGLMPYIYVLCAGLVLGAVAGIFFLIGADRRRMNGAAGILCLLAGAALVIAITLSRYSYMPTGLLRDWVYAIYSPLYIALVLLAVCCKLSLLSSSAENGFVNSGESPLLREEKSIGIAIILCFLTFGIYYIAWVHGICKRIRLLAGESSACGGEVALFFLVPFYAWYWIYTRSKKLAKAGVNRGIALEDRSVINLVLAIVNLGIVSIALIQSDLNRAVAGFRLADAPAQA